MRIGELGESTGTPVQTIRYYEKAGLLPRPGRSEANYRVYNNHHVDRLSFIRHCRGLDMTLDEIRVLLRFKDAPTQNCQEVNVLLDEHIEHVVQRMRELRALARQLKVLRGLCQSARDSAHCGILGELSQSAPDLKSAMAGTDSRLGHVHSPRRRGARAR